MELFPSPGECSYQNGSAVAIFLINLLLLCFGLLLFFGFFSRGRRYGTTKKLVFQFIENLLDAYRFLFLSTTATETSTLVEGIAGLRAAAVCWNGGHVRCAKERHCGGPRNLIITTRWVSTNTHIIMNKHLRIPKSGAARIG